MTEKEKINELTKQVRKLSDVIQQVSELICAKDIKHPIQEIYELIESAQRQHEAGSYTVASKALDEAKTNALVCQLDKDVFFVLGEFIKHYQESYISITKETKYNKEPLASEFGSSCDLRRLKSSNYI